LVFRGLISAGGGAERLRDGGAIGVWAPKGISAGIAGLTGDGGEPGGTVADLEEGGGEPIEIVLKPKFWSYQNPYLRLLMTTGSAVLRRRGK
jgi:hypothetical protein